MTDSYRTPDEPAEYTPRVTSTDNSDNAATVDAETRASIARRSWILSTPIGRSTRTTVPAGSPYSDGGWA